MTDYKQKYLDLKSKFISAVDTSYRLGYEQGAKDKELETLQMQQQQQMAAMQQQMMGGMGNPPVEEEQPSPEDQAAQFEQAQEQETVDNQVSELESGIQELSDLLNKGEVDKTAASGLLENLTKSLEKINEIRQYQELKKNMEAIKKIGKATKKVESLSLSFKNNASKEQKQALSMQKAIVNDIMAKWEEEEKEAEKGILGALKLK